MAHPIRIFFINCPTLDVDAASYLLLAQNKYQSTIQFEINHFWICGLDNPLSFNSHASRLIDRLPKSKRLARWANAKFDLTRAPRFKGVLGKHTWLDASAEAIGNYDSWFNKSSYHKHDSQPCRSIIITETPLKGGYISYGSNEIFFISVANWKSYFGPGSALEFILFNVQRAALKLGLNANGWHFSTRGCINDFHIHQPDTRISAYLGSLCSTCHSKLEASTSPVVAAEMKQFLSNQWIGSKGDPSSVASILSSNYKYELKRSTGLRPSLWHSATESIRNELGRETIAFLKYAIIIGTTILLYHIFPDFYQIIKGK